MPKLIPVDHDPFSTDHISSQVAEIRTEISDLVSKVNTFGSAAHQIDTAIHDDMRKVAEAINAVGNYFNDSLNAIRDEIANSVQRTDGGKEPRKVSGKHAAVANELGTLRDQIGDFGKAVTSKLDAMAAPPGMAAALKIIRDSSGNAVKVNKGGKMFDIERRDGKIVGIVPEGQIEPPPPKRAGAAKRYG